MASFAALAESISRLQNFDPDDLSAITEERRSLTSSIGSASIGNYSSSLRESIPRADSIREGPERRVSIVPTMDKIPIDTDNPAPKATLPSFDFDRVVNAFSIMAVKKRLTQQNDVHHRHQEMLVRHRSKENGYDTFGNQQEEDRELLQTPKDKAMTRWFLTLLTGIMCAVVAILIVYGVTRIGTFRAIRLNWHLDVAAGTSDWNNVNTRYNYKGFWWGLAHSYGYHFASQGYIYVFAMYASYNAFLALASAVLCIYFAPNAVGSGIPEVKAYLNGVCVESFADMNVFLTKIVATILSVSSGLIVGPEGPLVHLGAIIGQGVTKTTRLDAAIRTMQRNWPGLAGLLGMAPLHGPGETRAKLDGDMSLRNITKRVSRIEGKKKPKTFQRMRHVHNVPHDPRHSIVLAPNGLLTSVLETKDDDDQGSSNQQSGWSPNWIFISQFTAELSRFRNDTDRRDLISIGVATGFAAAFGAPVGGLLYSFEEASSYYSIPLMWRTLAATAIGTFVIAMYYGDIAQYSILSLGNPVKEGEADVEIHRKFAELPIYILIGIGGGLIGSFFNSCYIWTNTRRIKFYSNVKNSTVANFWNLFEVALVSLITSTVTFAMPVYLPQAWVCTDSESHYSYKNESGDWFEHQYNCPNGQFNEFAAILLGSRDEALDAILTDPTQFQSTTLLSCGLAFIFLMIVTFGVKLPCGLFMPSLLSGAMLGGWAGIILQKHVMRSINPAHLSLLGATALLAGIQRTTVSLCVIMMEATGQVKILIPLIISVVVARYVADIFTEGFYHVNRHLPILNPRKSSIRLLLLLLFLFLNSMLLRCHQ